MREELEHAALVTVAIPISRLQWVQQGQEVRIDGKLFDVKSYKLRDDKVLLTGLFDEEEDLLVERISDIQNNEPDKTNSSLIIFKWLGCFSLCIKNDDLNTVSLIIQQEYPLSAAINFYDPGILIDPPPPKQISWRMLSA